MKKVVFILTVFFAMISCKTETKETKKIEEVKAIKTPIVTIGEFNSKAGDYIDNEIQIRGIVDHVCKHGGKKILMVTDEGDVHIVSKERFNENLKGSEIILTGIVLEKRIDEATCLKMEEDNIKNHSEGKSSKEQFNSKKEHIQKYRDEMKANNANYISNYSLQYVSHTKAE